MRYTRRTCDPTREIKIPTLIVHGGADVMVPFEASARKLAEEIPHAQLKVCENA